MAFYLCFFCFVFIYYFFFFNFSSQLQLPHVASLCVCVCCVFQFVCLLIYATLQFFQINLHSHFELTVFCLLHFHRFAIFHNTPTPHICISKPFDSPVEPGLASHYDGFSLSLNVFDSVSIFYELEIEVTWGAAVLEAAVSSSFPGKSKLWSFRKQNWKYENESTPTQTGLRCEKIKYQSIK